MKSICACLLLSLATAGLRSEVSNNEQPTGVPLPSASLNISAASNESPRPIIFKTGPQPVLSPEENIIVAQARLELEQDRELIELSAQIKALAEKRIKLADEKLQKISPKAAAILQDFKERQQKVKAEYDAKLEAAIAKLKAEEGKAR